MTLLQFLRQARHLHLQFLSGALSEPPIYVLGNPSADLDSIISAILYSYCASNRLPAKSPRAHIPLLNLPNVPAGSELYRLRPEFVTALHLSTNCPPLKPDERFETSPSSAGKLLRDHVVTTADFAQSLHGQFVLNNVTADVTMVDWNALPYPTDGQQGQGSVAGLPGVFFRTVGCIDHHVDEHFVPRIESNSDDQPVIIQPGPGSCSSLITNEMVHRGLWTTRADASTTAETAQVAKLALAAVLIDTSNLTAEGKVTDADVGAVEFLCKEVEKEDPSWKKGPFYEQILTAKRNSLDLLTLPEVLDRDYKDWTETTSGKSVKLGFCSSVKPIRWIIEKAGGPVEFLDALGLFAGIEEKQLDLAVVMTSFTHEDRFSRELFVCAKCDCAPAVDGAKAFVAQAGSELGLEEWSDLDSDFPESKQHEIRSSLDGEDDGWWRRLWVQTNTTASRKQVAPLLRKAVTKS